jgi:hypothetical protein
VIPVPGTTGPAMVGSLGVAANTLPWLSATHRNEVSGLVPAISTGAPAEGSGRHGGIDTPPTSPAGGIPGQAFAGSIRDRRRAA